MSVHRIQQGGQENGFGSNKAIWGREKTRFRWGRPLGGVQVGHGSLWTGGDKQAVTIVSHREFAEGVAAGPGQGVFHIWSCTRELLLLSVLSSCVLRGS